MAKIIANSVLSNPEVNFKPIYCGGNGKATVDRIRNALKPKRIHTFPEFESRSLDGYKVVLLDEIHNMHSRSQQKLRKLIEAKRHSIRF